MEKTIIGFVFLYIGLGGITFPFYIYDEYLRNNAGHMDIESYYGEYFERFPSYNIVLYLVIWPFPYFIALIFNKKSTLNRFIFRVLKEIEDTLK